MSRITRALIVCLAWFRRYVWQFKAARAGIILVSLGSLLDFHSRVETFYKWVDVLMRPATLLMLQSGWFHLVLIAIGFVLLYWSTVRGKTTEPKLTVDERVARLDSVTPWEKIPETEKRLKALEQTHGPGEEHSRAYVQARHATDKVNAFGRAAIETAKSVPERTGIQIRLFDLMYEVGDIVTDFNRLREMYGWEAVPAKSPFFKWRPTGRDNQMSDHVIREWERWARSLEIHKSNCVSLTINQGIQIDGGELFTRIANWGDSTSSGDAVRELLIKQGARLKKLRDDHAASWATDAEERFTKS